jgi:hypothetical protein
MVAGFEVEVDAMIWLAEQLAVVCWMLIVSMSE